MLIPKKWPIKLIFVVIFIHRVSIFRKEVNNVQNENKFSAYVRSF